MTVHESIVAILDAKNEKLQARVWELEAEQQVIIASLEEEIARLLNWIRGATLRSYVSHFPDCALRNPELDENGLRLSCSCDCGLDEILKGGEP